jgi:Pyruvate/2-oxoacid:ferredoxin oxidoreductase gamma subunit
MRDAVRDSVPAGTEELNLAAFDHGFEYAQEMEKAPTEAQQLQEVTA